MHDSFDTTTTIVFAILAIVVIWKLRSVLGTRTGMERPPRDPFQRRPNGDLGPERNYTKSEDGKVIRLPGAANDPGPVPGGEPAAGDPKRWSKVAEPNGKAWAGLDALRAADPKFDAEAFLEGGKIAYEMVVSAYATGDRKTLKSLLASEVFDSFSGAIAGREQRGEKLETTFVSMEKAMIEDAQLRGPAGQITVRFIAKLITVTRDKNDAVIEGDPEKVVDMVDVWTFARNVQSRDPNWKLVATETGH
jgi:predicted lipid-binding transport protein (Tim44 family)